MPDAYLSCDEIHRHQSSPDNSAHIVRQTNRQRNPQSEHVLRDEIPLPVRLNPVLVHYLTGAIQTGAGGRTHLKTNQHLQAAYAIVATCYFFKSCTGQTNTARRLLHHIILKPQHLPLARRQISIGCFKILREQRIPTFLDPLPQGLSWRRWRTGTGAYCQYQRRHGEFHGGFESCHFHKISVFCLLGFNCYLRS